MSGECNVCGMYGCVESNHTRYMCECIMFDINQRLEKNLSTSDRVWLQELAEQMLYIYNNEGNKMNVSQFVNSKGNPAANHIVITTEKGQYLKSYDSLVAFRPHDNLALKRLGSDWDYSATTLKHVKQFMGWAGYTKSELKKQIDLGNIVLTELEVE